LFLLLAGCAAVETTCDIQAGGSWGGIIEDNGVDAVSGATKLRPGIGIHPVFTIKDRMIETGLDFLSYNQTFTYLDNTENYNGTREFSYGELRLPLTYNIQFFRDENRQGKLLLKLGISGGLRIYENIRDNGAVPDYTFDRFSLAPTFGLSSVPLRINDRLSLGLYFDFMRGTVIYNDFYTSADLAGNISNLKFGAVLRLK
jgi:hypothetical protein